MRASGISLDDHILTGATGLFGISEWEQLGGFENLLIRATEPPGRVLRLTHTSRRSEDLVVAEFGFMEHLANAGVPTVAPVHSVNGRLVEHVTTSDGDVIVVTCMTEAAGRHRPRNEWTPSDIGSYGRLLGSMHAAAAGFEPEEPRRPSWAEPIFDVGYSADADPDIFERRFEVHRAAREAEPDTPEILIHQDAHLGNIFITDEGGLTIFDFDDSAYGTASHDIAIVLFYWLMGREGDLHAETRRFADHFKAGYEGFATLPADWPERAEAYFSLRELDIYWLVQLEDAAEWHPFEERFMEGRRNRILGGTPYLGAPLADILG